MYYVWMENYWKRVEPFAGLTEMEMAYHYRKYKLTVVKFFNPNDPRFDL